MYFKVGIDGVMASSKKHALEIYNNHHNTNETIVEEITAIEKVDHFGNEIPRPLTWHKSAAEAKNTTISEIFWYYGTVSIIEGLFER